MVAINPKDIINRYSEVSEIYLKDKKKLTRLIDAAKKAVGNKTLGPMDELFEKVELFRGIIADYISGDYRDIPWGSLIMVVAAILYFVNPLDLIPDAILGAGLIDDFTLVAFVVSQISSDIEKYKRWKTQQIA